MSAYVLSDIHGRKDRFDSIMDQIKLKPEDTLYILGDVIDRNVDGDALLMQIMNMPNAKMLLGNHEYMMMNALFLERTPWKNDHSVEDLWIWYNNGGYVTHAAFRALPKDDQDRIVQFILRLPLEADVEVGGRKFHLVHSAPTSLFRSRPSYYRLKYLDETAYSVWCRDVDFDKLPDDSTLIFGHTPTNHYIGSKEYPLEVWLCPNGKAIGIDCGCAFDIGRLACIRLDDMTVFYSEDKNERWPAKMSSSKCMRKNVPTAKQ